MNVRILDITQWDDVEFDIMNESFAGCQNLDVTATDAPILSELDLPALILSFYDCNIKHAKFSQWNTVGIGNMESTFRDCANLETIEISTWNTSVVTRMPAMFDGCVKLREIDIAGWNVGNVDRFSHMFNNCVSLGSIDLTGWNVGAADAMDGMFAGCGNIDVIGVEGWEPFNINTFFLESLSSMFLGSTLPTSRYDALLQNWSSKAASFTNTGIFFHGGNSKYSASSQSYRDILTGAPYNWTITDGGQV
jgi:surface protein